MRFAPFFVAGVAIMVAACNANRQTQPVIDPVGPARPETPSTALPEGAGCSAAVSRYKSVIENDLSMGHVNQGVYNQIQGEISEAASACSAGQDAKAISLVRASKARHGYPGG